jgi:hypothetical protein
VDQQQQIQLQQQKRQHEHEQQQQQQQTKKSGKSASPALLEKMQIKQETTGWLYFLGLFLDCALLFTFHPYSHIFSFS